MKIELWAKRIHGKGHVYLETINVPTSAREWRIPVVGRAGIGSHKDLTTTSSSPMSAQRVFVWQHDPLSKLVDGLPKFLEE